MPSRIDTERIKPFRLVKYFTFTSLIAVFIGTLVLSLLNIHWARSFQLKKSQDYALLLMENLNHQVFLQFVVPVVLKYGKIELSNQEQFQRMDDVVRSTLHSFHVAMVNIYDMKNKISYSFDSELVGKQNRGGALYNRALEGHIGYKLLQQGYTWGIPLGIPKKSLLITFAPLRAEREFLRISGPVLGVVEIVQDVTEDYRTIFRYQVTLIQTSGLVMSILLLVLIFVVKRGEAIIEKRSLEKHRLEKKLNRARHLSSLGEMTAGISHEIRNPLGIIKSSAELLKKKMASVDPGNPIPDVIVQEATRLNDIITDFLNFARPREPDVTPCNLDEIIERNINFLAPRIQEQGLVIEKDIGPHFPEIPADANMLYQAFLNILLNAMQAMSYGGSIGIHAAAADGRARIFFEDSGPGVSREIEEKIWDPFFTTKEKGTGLGLGIVKNIIDAHGGSILIENRPEGGARVAVDLPLKPRS